MKLFLIPTIIGILGAYTNDYILFIISLFVCTVIIILNEYVTYKKAIIMLLISVLFLTYTVNIINDIENHIYSKNDYVNGEFKISKKLGSGYICSSNGDYFLVYTKKSYLSGDIVEIKGKKQKIQKRSNPYVFDLRKYYTIKKISCIIFPETEKKIGVSNDLSSIVKRNSEKTRNWVYSRLSLSLTEDELGFMMSIMTGDKEEISNNTSTSFRKTGITHIMSVSGAHVAFVLMPFLFIFNKFIKNKRKRAFFSIFPPIGYIFITGIKPSILRATMMVVIYMIIKIVKKEKNTIDVVFITCIIILIINPLYLFDTGFILSFGATLGIILLNEKIYISFHLNKLPNIIGKAGSLSISAQLSVLPITLTLFNTFSVVSLIANIVFVPIVSIFMIAGFIICIIPSLGGIIEPILSIYLTSIDKFALFKFAQINAYSIHIVGIIAYYFLIYEFFYNKSKNILYKTVLFSIIILVMFPRFNSNNFEVNFLSCGNGDCTFIKAEDKNILIDGGNDKINFGEYKLVPYLKNRGIFHLDLVIATHSDSDHAKELNDVLKNISVGALLIPKINNKVLKDKFNELLITAQKSNISVYNVSSRNTVILNNKTKLIIISPNEDDLWETPNHYSLVFKLIYKELEILFTGDIEKENEYNLAMKEDISCDILKVAHHGSSSSSTPEFINKASYFSAVVSCGENNFGHPDPEIIERLNKVGKIYTTWYDGRIKLYEKFNKFYIEKYN